MNRTGIHRSRVGSPGAVLTLVLPALLLLLPPGCDSDSSTTRPGDCPPLDFTTGLHGRVTVDGGPLVLSLAADNRAAWLAGDVTEHITVGTSTDSTGAYTLPVPAGRYELKYSVEVAPRLAQSGYIDGEGGLHTDPRIFVVPDSVPMRLDVSMNDVQLHLHIPPGWGDLGFEPFVEPRIPVRMRTEVVGEDEWVVHMFGLPQDSYLFGMGNASGKLWLPPTYFPAQAGVMSVTGAGTETFDYTIPAVGSLEGNLVGSCLEMDLPPPSFIRMLLDICGPDSIAVLHAAPDTTDGRYAIPIYAPFPAARVRISYGPIVRWYGGATFEQATPIDLEAGRTSRLDIEDRGIAVRIPDLTFYCVSLHGTTGRKIATLPSSWWNGQAGDPWYTSDRVPLPNLVPGTYYLYVDCLPDPYPSQWYRATLEFGQATPIVVAEGDVKVPVLVDTLRTY